MNPLGMTDAHQAHQEMNKALREEAQGDATVTDRASAFCG
jgi:hypothetical protein